ncbi:MAG TPA: hypothetical protein VFU76_18195 [Terriglobales bacterium]|nr:hypothetical protein [Terriglobales bacterium]
MVTIIRHSAFGIRQSLAIPHPLAGRVKGGDERRPVLEHHPLQGFDFQAQLLNLARLLLEDFLDLRINCAHGTEPTARRHRRL